MLVHGVHLVDGFRHQSSSGLSVCLLSLELMHVTKESGLNGASDTAQSVSEYEWQVLLQRNQASDRAQGYIHVESCKIRSDPSEC